MIRFISSIFRPAAHEDMLDDGGPEGKGMTRSLALGLAVAILAGVVLVYLPVTHADFVWDDWPSMRYLQGDQWLHYVFRDFNNWGAYFRPLGVAFFALQIKIFNGTPGPMHGVSLALHLINISLLGLLTLRIGSLIGTSQKRRTYTALACMLLYGMHPALIETVAWIGPQFDLLVTMFTLCALLTTLSAEKPGTRASALTALFFLAACTKESASILPLLVVIFDWALHARNNEQTFPGIVRAVIRRNWQAYIGMLAAGILYLILRHGALGNISYLARSDLTNLLPHFQETCFIYLNYLRIILWPFSGINPLHDVDVTSFGSLSTITLLTDAAVIAVVVAGFYLAIRRMAASGFIILAVTAALLPVLRILPVAFDRSLYHERYATLAITVTCALLPLLKWPRYDAEAHSRDRASQLLAPIAIFFWLAFSIVNIQIIAPKWRNDTTLWEWVVATNPNSTQGKDNLLNAYVQAGNWRDAQTFADKLLVEPVACSPCMLHLAKIALDQNDIARAIGALKRAENTPLVRGVTEARQLYYHQLGRLLIMQNRYGESVQILTLAIQLKPDDVEAKQYLVKANAMLAQP
jgi:hypothetical protein